MIVILCIGTGKLPGFIRRILAKYVDYMIIGNWHRVDLKLLRLVKPVELLWAITIKMVTSSTVILAELQLIFIKH